MIAVRGTKTQLDICAYPISISGYDFVLECKPIHLLTFGKASLQMFILVPRTYIIKWATNTVPLIMFPCS